ncbi:MAG: NeuD/PglB/VioB family sugar acetyltransferase [Actinobacteria bacterium]|nr:NeuD/PglB/VioB family sugar acetyltransferase [Actinomycetota bacterium]
MTSEVVLYGASSFCQHVMTWLEDVAETLNLEISGFVDDDTALHGQERGGHEVLGGREWLLRRASERPLGVVFGLSDPRDRARIVSCLDHASIDFPSVVHSTAVVSRHASLGQGTVVGPRTVISVNTVLSEFVTVASGCTVEHDVSVGSYSTLLPASNLCGGATLGDRVSIGTNATVLGGVDVGSDTIVGAGAVVGDDLPNGCTAVGH